MLSIQEPEKFRAFIKANLFPLLFIEEQVISLLCCIALSQEHGEGQTFRPTSNLRQNNAKHFVTADDGWVMTLLCFHKLSICLQFVASAHFKFNFPTLFLLRLQRGP